MSPNTEVNTSPATPPAPSDGIVLPDYRVPVPDRTVFSPAFEFVEWRAYTILSGPETEYYPAPDAKKVKYSNAFKSKEQIEEEEHYETPVEDLLPYKKIRDKWVYVFQDHRSNFSWFGEYYLDEESNICPVDLDGARDLDAGDRPAPQKRLGKLACLAHTISGKPAYYYAYVSRVRLPHNSIRRLAAEGKDLLESVNVNVAVTEPKGSDVPLCEKLIQERDKMKAPVGWRFGAVDPLSVAYQMGREHILARHELVASSLPTTEQSREQQRKVEERNAKYMIGGLLTQIMAGDPNTKESLSELVRSEFDKAGNKLEGAEVINAFVKTEASRQHRLLNNAETAAAALCTWLASSLVDIARAAHFANADDAPAFIRVYGQATYRLIESEAGRVFFGDLLAKPEHWTHKFALPNGTPSSTIVSIVNASGSAMFTLSEQLATRYLQSYGALAADRAVDSLNTVVGAEVYLAKKVTAINPNKGGKVELTEIRMTPDAGKKLAKFFGGESTAKSAVNTGLYFAGIASFALAMGALRDAGFENLTPSGALSIISGVIDVTGSTLGLVTDASKANLAVLGGISAMIGFGCAVLDMTSAADRHDYVSLAGSSMNALGASLTLMSCVLTAAGAGSSLTLVGFPAGAALAIVGGLIGAAGSFVTAWGGQSDLETFVAHSAFGRHYGSGGVMSWSCGWPMRDFKAVPSLQIKSLLNLLTTFKVEYSKGFREAAIEIKMGFVQAHSKFHIEFTNTYKGGWQPYTSEITVTVGGGATQQISGYALAAVNHKPTIKWPNAAPSAYVDARHDPKLYNEVELLHSSCVVWLDLDGSGSSFFPYHQKKRPKAEKEIRSSL